MKIIERGHIYELDSESGTGIYPYGDQRIQFVNQQKDQEHGGTTTQEVIRALLDRTRHCANCMPHPVNERIIYHLRMALTLHELPTVDGSHLELPSEVLPTGPVTAELLPHPLDGKKTINHLSD